MKTEYKEGELLEFNEKGDTKLFGLDYTEMVYVEKGTFNIGDNSSGFENEKEVTITFDSGYFIGKYPVTQEFYEYIEGENPSKFKGKHRPVENISWNDIGAKGNNFLKVLNNKVEESNSIDIKGWFSLPSETQWEYAARGGKAWNKLKLEFAGSNNLHDVGWFDENSNNRVMPVGLKQPNILGIYDMSGNVYEWCQDFYEVDYLKNPKNGKDYEQSGPFRVIRGGLWCNQHRNCRVALRTNGNPVIRLEFYGFRLVFSTF